MVQRHREDIFDAIRDTLIEKDQQLNYSTLFTEVNYRLNPALKKLEGKHYAISSRDFTEELNMMIKEGKLNKTEDTLSKKKIKPVYFSLTEDAKKEHQFDILGINRDKESRLKLYQLIFLYSTIGSVKLVPENKVDEVLSRIPVPRKDLVIEGWNHTNGTNYFEITYKRIDYTKISKIILANRAELASKVLECLRQHVEPEDTSFIPDVKVYYVFRHLNFSEDKVIEFIEDRRKNKKGNIIAPIVSDILLTPRKVTKAFSILHKSGLIKHARDIFSDQTGFAIADESLQNLINEIWSIHEHELTWIRTKINYIEEPTDEEKEWLKLIYGEKQAMKMIKDGNNNRLFIKKGEKELKDKQNDMGFNGAVADALIKRLNEKYGKKIQEYNFPSTLVEGVCFRRIFSK